jgi:hypothetical protein
MKSVGCCGERALSVESRRLSSSDDLLRPRLASTSRLHAGTFSMMERRRWRKMLRLAFVGCHPVLYVLCFLVRHTTSSCEMTVEKTTLLSKVRKDVEDKKDEIS